MVESRVGGAVVEEAMVIIRRIVVEPDNVVAVDAKGLGGKTARIIERGEGNGQGLFRSGRPQQCDQDEGHWYRSQGRSPYCWFSIGMEKWTCDLRNETFHSVAPWVCGTIKKPSARRANRALRAAPRPGRDQLVGEISPADLFRNQGSAFKSS